MSKLYFLLTLNIRKHLFLNMTKYIWIFFFFFFLFFFHDSKAQLGPWSLQSSTSSHLCPLLTFSNSCLSTPHYHPCPLHRTISFWAFQLFFLWIYEYYFHAMIQVQVLKKITFQGALLCGFSGSASVFSGQAVSWSFEALWTTCPTTQHHTPADQNLQQPCCENLKSAEFNFMM